MKFSIVTPVFNGMPQIKRCIGSVRGQTSDQVEVEHIVQDGGSADGTAAFLSEYRQRTDVLEQDNYRFASVSQPDNGMYDAINMGWARASGDIVAWLNSDEQYLPGTLEKVAAYFNNDPQVDAMFGNHIVVSDSGEAIAARREIPLRRMFVANCFLYAASCTTFFSRRLLDRGILHLNDNYKYSADADLILRLMDEGISFGHLNEYLSLFGVAPGQNLSFLSAMDKESRMIHDMHGALPFAVGRRCIQAVRWCERLVKGCYSNVPLEYRYVMDEAGNSMPYSLPKVSFRLDWKKLR